VFRKKRKLKWKSTRRNCAETGLIVDDGNEDTKVGFIRSS